MMNVVLMLLLAGLADSPPGAQLQTPSDWKWKTDVPAELTVEQKVPPGKWLFVAMPPGWHITTGPGALLYHPDYKGLGRFVLETEIFLFPGTSQQEYGLFLGGHGLDGDTRYTAFVIRRDGSAAILSAAGTELRELSAWTRHPAVLAHPGNDDTVKNLLRVDVQPAKLAFLVNGVEVASVPRAEVTTEGRFGFRVGKDMNLHIVRLDATYQLAPPRRERPSQ
jgi:hypothetical protein